VKTRGVLIIPSFKFQKRGLGFSSIGDIIDRADACNLLENSNNYFHKPCICQTLTKMDQCMARKSDITAESRHAEQVSIIQKGLPVQVTGPSIHTSRDISIFEVVNVSCIVARDEK
jgi:hypothetical protein